MKINGFTLVEIIVVMAITAIVGTILVAIFTNTLRGSNKSQILSVIKQNGQAVLENMDNTIRNSDYVACVTPSGNTFVIVKNGTYSRYRFFAPVGAVNGNIQQDNPAPPALGDISSFMHTLCIDDSDPLVGQITLTDTSTQTGVSVKCIVPNCSTNPIFHQDPAAGYRDQITIKFTLSPGVNAPSIISSQIDPVVFQTTIGLR